MVCGVVWCGVVCVCVVWCGVCGVVCACMCALCVCVRDFKLILNE